MNTLLTLHKEHSFPSFTLIKSFFINSFAILNKQKKETFIILGVLTSIITSLIFMMLFSWFIPTIKYLLTLLGTQPLEDIPKSWMLSTLLFCILIYCIISCLMVFIKNIFVTLSFNYYNDRHFLSYNEIMRFSFRRLPKTLLVNLSIFILLAMFIFLTFYIAYLSAQPYFYFKDMSIKLLGDSLLISRKSLIIFSSVSIIGLLVTIGLASFFQLAQMLTLLYDIKIAKALKYSFLLIKNNYKINLSVFFFSNLISIVCVILVVFLLSISVIGLALLVPIYLLIKIIRYLFSSQVMLYHYTNYINTNAFSVNAVNLYKIFFHLFVDTNTKNADSLAV